ncbi:zinc-dependent alcohol dehydrogenase family protein [soil metagenome]
MRAVEFRGAGSLALVERPDPVAGPGEVLVAPEAVGICATDLEILDGVMAYFRTGDASYPIVPGHEWIGTVVSTGSAVAGLRPGDTVVGDPSAGCGSCARCHAGRYHLCARRIETGIMGRDGAMATLMLAPATATHLVHRPVWDAGALIEPASVALNAARHAPCRGSTVLVLGAGAIGLLALQCARLEGAARVIVANSRRADRLELARRLGADETLLLPQDAARALRNLAGDDGIDVVLLCTGATAAMDLAVEITRPGGTVVVVGLFGAPRVPVDLDTVVTNDLRLIGVNGSPHLWPDTIAAATGGALLLDPLVSHRFPLARAAEALELARRAPAGTLKVLVTPQREEV